MNREKGAVADARQTLKDFVEQVNWLIIASDPRQGIDLDRESRQAGKPVSSPPPGGGPQAASARRLLEKKLRWIRRETRDIAKWLESPVYVGDGRGPRKRCGECKRFVKSGWAHCASCGAKLNGGSTLGKQVD